MPWVGIVASVGGQLLSGAMSGGSADEAAGVQSQSADAAIEELRRQYDITRADAERMYALIREDQAPFRDIGVAANKRLATLLGLDVAPSTATNFTGSGMGPSLESRDAIRQRLAPQFTTAGPGTAPREYTGGVESGIRQLLIKDRNPHIFGGAGAPTVDEAALNAAVEAELAKQQAALEASQQAAVARSADERAASARDPAFGSLLKKFGLDDLNSDVVYNSGLKFGLDQGRDAINARAIAGGGYDSGATLKALTKWGNDYGSTKAGEAYERFMRDKSSVYGMLSGTAGAGQNATNAISGYGTNLTGITGGAGTNMANNVADLITQGGNARAAGIVAGGNMWGNASNALTSGVNNWQDRQAIERMEALRRGSWSPPTTTSWQMLP